MCGRGRGRGGLGQLQGAASEDFMLEVVEIGQGEGQRVSNAEESSGATRVPGRPARCSPRGCRTCTWGVCYHSSHCQRGATHPERNNNK